MIYQYQCEKCKEEFELMLTVTEYETVKATCPACNTNKVRRIIGKIPIKFNGIGYTKTFIN